MTIVVAFRYGTRAYIAADSLVTYEGPGLEVVNGELAYFDEQLPAWAADHGQKVLSLGPVTIGLSGEAGPCNEFVKVLERLLRKGWEAEEAVRTAANSVTGADESWSIAAAWVEENGSKLLILDNAAPPQPLEPNQISALGSGGLALDRLADDFFSHLAAVEQWPGDLEERILVSLLGWLQLHSITDRELMGPHVGGAFYGRVVAPTGSRWMPDLRYYLLGHDQRAPRHLFVGVREDALVVRDVARRRERAARYPTWTDEQVARYKAEPRSTRWFAPYLVAINPETKGGVILEHDDDGWHPEVAYVQVRLRSCDLPGATDQDLLTTILAHLDVVVPVFAAGVIEVLVRRSDLPRLDFMGRAKATSRAPVSPTHILESAWSADETMEARLLPGKRGAPSIPMYSRSEMIVPAFMQISELAGRTRALAADAPVPPGCVYLPPSSSAGQ